MTRPIIGRVAPEQGRTTGAPAPVREPGTARIAVDLLGGDQAPAVVVDGALRACQADPALHLLLVGPIDAAGAVLAALDPADQRPGPHAADAGRADRPATARVRTARAGSSPACVRPCSRSPRAWPTRSSRPATPAPPSPRPRSAWAAGPACAVRRWPRCCPPRPAGSCCSTSARRSTRTRRPWPPTRCSAPPTPSVVHQIAGRGSACSPSAPSGARATACAARCRAS